MTPNILRRMVALLDGGLASKSNFRPKDQRGPSLILIAFKGLNKQSSAKTSMAKKLKIYIQQAFSLLSIPNVLFPSSSFRTIEFIDENENSCWLKELLNTHSYRECMYVLKKWDIIYI